MKNPDELSVGPPWLREAIDLYRSGNPLDMRAEPAPHRAIAYLDRHLHIGAPWCGIFVAHCLRKTLPGTKIPRGHMRARPWMSWGRATTPQLGAVMVFWHYFRGSPFGHVGFYWGEDEDNIHVLGGNQHDLITTTRYSKSRLIGCRWPEGEKEVA